MNFILYYLIALVTTSSFALVATSCFTLVATSAFMMDTLTFATVCFVAAILSTSKTSIIWGHLFNCFYLIYKIVFSISRHSTTRTYFINSKILVYKILFSINYACYDAFLYACDKSPCVYLPPS